MINNSRIAVLITCHNRKEKTVKCLDSLFNQDFLGVYFKIDVFLVDDGSTDGTSQVVRDKFPDVNIINGTGHLYWNRGMHLAWKIARKTFEYDFYLWLNDDTFLYVNAIAQMLDGAKLTKLESAICGNTFSILNAEISYGGYSKEGDLLIPNGHLQEVHSFNGNVVLIPKYVFEKVGILDSRYPHAIGDFDYALRIRKNNLVSYVTKGFIATCEGADELPIWCSPDFTFVKRVKSLYSPLGNSHPYYYFIFERQHYGVIISIKHFISIHFRLAFPSLWLKKKN
jgi:GT2 family glycosyltransferase